MKRIIYAIGLVGLGLASTSCNNFLSTEPLSDFTNEGSRDTTTQHSIYGNAAEARSGMNGAYAAFKTDIFELQNYIYGDVQSDNCYLGNDELAGTEEDNLTINAMNSNIKDCWKQYFALTSAATTVMENVRLMTDGNISQEDRNAIIAEAQFVRSFGFFDIVRMWGDAPLVLKLIPPITPENIDRVYPMLYPPRTDAEKVYDAIVNDLNAAIPNLPASNKGSSTATKGAAYALLAKVHATRGTKSSRNYNKVVEYCDKVVEQGYQLMPEYEKLWQPENKFTSESIFELYFTTQNGNWAYWVLLKEGDGTVTWRRYCTPTHELLSKYEPNDARKNSTWVWRKVPYEVYFPANSYPLAYKIREKNSEIILMRLADILLLKAEALVELNRIPEAMALVNQIRNRAGLTDLSANLPQPAARLAVELERQLELAMEAQRWFDLMRNDRMVEVMSKHKDKNGNLLIKQVDKFRTLLPVPQSELDVNSSLTQNHGY